jgi:glucose-6-phosphate 1-dehydrogenase
METPKLPDAYETLIASAFRADKNLFQGFDEIRASWQFIDTLRTQFSSLPLYTYPKGSAETL